MLTTVVSRHAGMWSATRWTGCSPSAAILMSRGCQGVATLAMVEATIEWDGRTSSVRRYYVSSARLTAPRLRGSSRALADREWLALGLGYDFRRGPRRNRRDHGPENLAVLRKLALNVLRCARPDISIRRKRKRSGWSDEFARSVLGQMR
jgi:hypothetical protein